MKTLKFILFCAVIVMGLNQTKAVAQVTFQTKDAILTTHTSQQDYQKHCMEDEMLSGLHATEQIISDAFLPSNTFQRGGNLNKSFKLSTIFQALCTLEAQTIHEKSKRFDSNHNLSRPYGQSYVYIYGHILI